MCLATWMHSKHCLWIACPRFNVESFNVSYTGHWHTTRMAAHHCFTCRHPNHCRVGYIPAIKVQGLGVTSGYSAALVLQSFAHQHQCRCSPYLRFYSRFSVFRLPMSPPFPWNTAPRMQHESCCTTRIPLASCRLSEKVVESSWKW